MWGRYILQTVMYIVLNIVLAANHLVYVVTKLIEKRKKVISMRRLVILSLCVVLAGVISASAVEPEPTPPNEVYADWSKLPAGYTIWKDLVSGDYQWRFPSGDADCGRYDRIVDAIDAAAAIEAYKKRIKESKWRQVVKQELSPYRVYWTDKNGKIVHPKCEHGVPDGAVGGCKKCIEEIRMLKPFPQGGPR